MSAMAGYVAAARQAKNCPIRFQPGERMALALPAVDRDASDRICALAIQDLIPVIQRMEKAGATTARAAEIGRSTFCTACKDRNAFVEFELSSPAAAPAAPAETDEGPVTAAELKRFALFSALPTRSLERILPFVRRRRQTEGTIVVRKGGRGERLYLLAEGEVEVLATDSNGVETVIATLGAGEVFGEMSLLTGEPVTATIRARKRAAFLAIEKPDFERLLAANPALNVFFTRLLAERLTNTSKRFLAALEKGMLGHLNTIAPSELVQAIEATAKSGILSARDGEKAIEMYIAAGRLHRITPNAAGGRPDALPADPEEAFYDFLAWKQGTFRFEAGERDEPRTFWKETTALLLEGVRRLDEAAG
jgi:CRP/FNR family cyclic AMP-dependent transcriptional regulator